MVRLIGLAVVLCPLCAGCLYYAYPTVSQIPALTVNDLEGNVHAFRIDIDRTVRDSAPGDAKPASLTQYTLSEIKFDRHVIPSQLEVAQVTGIYDPLHLVKKTNHERNEYTLAVRLYRRGSITQEVKSWESGRELIWLPAKDLLAQEKALDDLLAPPTAAGELARGTWWDRKDDKSLGLQPGLISTHLHRDALIFVAKEYQALIDTREASTPNMQPIRDRMRNKAQWLLGLSDRRPTPE